MFDLVGQKPIVMPHYPHMMAMDTEVWSMYLADPVVPIDEVWYDIHVGEPAKTTGGPGTLEARIAAGVTRKRIDAICRVNGGYWVVEIKPFGSMFALGQVLSYLRLFVREFRPPEIVLPVIVCFEADPDVIPEFKSRGVLVIEVGPPVKS